MKRGILKNIIFVAAALIIAVVSIILPGIILDYLNKKEVADLRDVPAEYYAGASEAVIVNSSRQLSDYENLQLVTGIWESEITTVDPSSCRLTEVEAKDLAAQRMSSMYTKGLYPSDLAADVNQWYVWDAAAYRAIDTTFKTYAANFWRISFYKYDHTEKHTVIMTETGSVLYAHAEMTEEGKLDDFTPVSARAGYFLLIDTKSLDYLANVVNNQSQFTLTEGGKRILGDEMTEADLQDFDREQVSHYTPVSEDFVPDDGILIYDNEHNVNFKVYMQKDSKNYTVIIQP